MTTPSAGAPGPDIGIDLSQFYEVFFEEANEHLAAMETLLLAIAEQPPTDEDLNGIFRAAHSIKGGAAMFGFNDVTELTHDCESVLDSLRKHELVMTPEMVEAFLQSRDVVTAQLARHRSGEGALADDVDAKHLRAQMQVFKNGGGVSVPAQSAKSVPPAVLTAPLAASAAGDDEASFARVLGTVAGVSKAATQQDMERVANAAVAPATLPASASVASSVAAPEGGEEGVGFGLFLDTRTLKENAQTVAAEIAKVPASAVPAPTAISKAAPTGVETTSIRVSVERVDQLINMVGELVITQAMITQRASKLDPVMMRDFLTAISDLERNTRSLQESVLSIRMLPISGVFNRFPRMVRDLAGKLAKKVELKMVGEATELDKGLIEKIVDPLTHLVRNSMDHGIELPEKRVAAGKPASGTITLSAFHQGGSIVIEVADDGAGLNRERILAKAKERGLNVSDTMADNEVWMLIFEAGFSTAAVVTDVSGRGVGMDVVKRNIGSLGGTVEIESRSGRGSTIRVRLPLTLAIMDGMSIAVGDQTYILPLASIVESLQMPASSVKSIAGGGRVVQVRTEYLPVIMLAEVFDIPSAKRGSWSGDLMLVIVEAEGTKTAALVDDLLGQHQVVVKNLETNYRKVPGVSGATIMGDGRVGFILDVPALVRRSRH